MRPTALVLSPAALLCAGLLPTVAIAQQRPDSSAGPRDRTNTLPLATSRTARFTTDAGTWMSVDVSPDGRTIAFDLLGDIYTVPITGGKATRIIGGNSVDMHPRFSPDGRTIAFVSDRNGSDATWLADSDGQRARMLTGGGVYPAWTPDGREIVVGNRLVDIRGGGGLTLQGVGTGASLTGDGRYIWFQSGTQAARYDRTDGSITARTNLAGGVFRPMVTKNGRRLAYFTRFEARTALVIRDLATGAERWVAIGMQPETFVPPAPFTGQLPPGVTPPPPPPPPGLGPLPSSAWMPDESAIVTSHGGKLWRIDATSGQSTPIPFTADVDIPLGALVRGTHPIGDSVTVREIREPSLSPDGRRAAFTALGKVWVMDLPGGTPRRLTSAPGGVEMSPVWTPDGQSVAYATWVDGAGGDIMQAGAGAGTTPAVDLTRSPALYARLAFTPDGSRLVFLRAPRQAWSQVVNETGIQPRTAAGAGTEINAELRWMPASGGAQTPIAMVADAGALPQGGMPHFAGDASRVLFHDGTSLVSVAWDGSDRKVVLARATPQTVLSPDGRHVLSRAGPRRHLFLFELPLVADSLVIDPTAAAPVVPVRRLTRAGGEFPAFSRDGARAIWTHGTTLHVYDIGQGDKATSDSIMAAIGRTTPPPGAATPATTPDTARRTPADSARRPAGPGGGAAADSATRWAPAYDAARHDVRIVLPADKPTGVVVLRGGRIVTMKEREVIENGDIVVTGNRITAVGARGSVRIPGGARVIDVSGKTILPGYVDIHASLGSPTQAHRTAVPQYLANLAFGVTTARDPESQATDIFTYGDRVDLGDLLGPRVVGTGPVALDSAAFMRTNPDARTFLAAYAGPWRTGSVRGDLNASRADRQRFLTVSRELGLTAAALSAPDFRKSLSAMLDGYSSQSGAYDIYPLQDDVARLMAASGLTWAPMLLGRIGTQNGLLHVLATEAPHQDPKVRRFSTHRDLDRLTRARVPWLVPDEYPFEQVATGAARIVAAGGKVALGSGGRVQGLAFHWEMWLLATGGMPAHDILRAATAFGADAIGLGAQLGSIEAGKLADLQVLDRNPITSIRNTNSVRYVMKNGRLYDAATLDQVAPLRKPIDNLWWLAAGPAEEQR